MISASKLLQISLLSVVLNEIVVSLSAARLRSTISCKDDECQLKERQFILYKTVKQALDSEFDIDGKDLVPWMRAVETLRRRFVQLDGAQTLNGSSLVLGLLDQERLKKSLEQFKSNDGRALIGLYGSSVNGRAQGLACSHWRVGQIQWAESKLKQNAELAPIFSNVHKNFVKKSAKKCLKHSCSSVDEHMSNTNSILRKVPKVVQSISVENEVNSTPSALPTLDDQNSSDRPGFEREFEAEELALCQFLRRTNDANCQISAKELGGISFVNESHKGKSNQAAGEGSSGGAPNLATSETVGLGDASSSKPAQDFISSSEALESNKTDVALAQCRSLKPMLSLNLFGLRWFLSEKLIDQQKFVSRTFWCPSLTYWLELDRLCDELEIVSSARNGTFAY